VNQDSLFAFIDGDPAYHLSYDTKVRHPIAMADVVDPDDSLVQMAQEPAHLTFG
jgi:hypothetical protein